MLNANVSDLETLEAIFCIPIEALLHNFMCPAEARANYPSH